MAEITLSVKITRGFTDVEDGAVYTVGQVVLTRIDKALQMISEGNAQVIDLGPIYTTPATFTGAGLLVLPFGAPVPAGTPAKTVIVRPTA